jgi:hypothetical protein
MMMCSLTDRRLRELADAGNREAQAEMVKRGLAGDPAMLAKRGVKGRPYEVDFRRYWSR